MGRRLRYDEYIDAYLDDLVGDGQYAASFNHLSDGIATVADVEVYVGNMAFHGQGSSRRVKGDKNDSDLGDVLALQRALSNAVRSMEAFTSRRIAALDKAVQARTEALERAKEAHPAGKGKRKK